MLIDARSLPDGQVIETDVCIVGAGAAGITLAREFVGQGFRVSIMESGGLEFDEASQSLCEGENVGLPYFPLEMVRSRQFGGTTSVWSGVSKPLDKIDFEKRDWLPYSGWPFEKSHLDPYYKRAQVICQLGPYRYDPPFWSDSQTAVLPFADGRVTTSIFQFSPPTRFGRVYRDEITRSDNIRLYLFANATEIETDETGHQVRRLHVATLSGNRFTLSARIFLLALGGIETPRLLLASDTIQSSGVGNPYDRVGRFFMEHPHLESGVLLPSNPDMTVDLYRRHSVRDIEIFGAIGLSEDVRREEQLLNFSATLTFTKGDRYEDALQSDGVHSLRYLYRMIRRGETPDDLIDHLGRMIRDIDDVAVTLSGELFSSDLPVYRLFNRTEQAPNPESRVTLSRERDRLGMRRVRLNWRLSDIDRRSVRRAHEIIGEELGRAGLGRLRVELDPDDPSWPPELMGGCHLMGTTRMHVDPKQGVTDENCRVHGISNLFISGPSLFPTCGCANPMLTIVALAVRLADHVKGIMA
jgi:choline dehydrogenase-like flavoprotein